MTVTHASAAERARLRWVRIIGLAVALEAVLFVTLVPMISLLSQRLLFLVIGMGCAVFGYIAGRFAGRRLPSGAMLHGLLVGVLATVIYLAIVAAQPDGLRAAVAFYGLGLFVSINALRIAGCVIGAIHQGRRVQPASRSV